MNEQPQNRTAEEIQEDFTEVVRVRREKLQNLIDAGKNPYEITKFDIDSNSKKIVDGFDENQVQTVKIAGRIVSRRIMGKASFCHILDNEGTIQIYVRKDMVGDETYADFKSWDIGDIVGLSGEVFRTHMGEISVKAQEITLLSKSLLPLPEKFHGLKDNDLRYRQRYVDLIANPEVKRTLVMRSQIIKCVREFLDNRGFI